jgi:4'-phosphopantetheinyl transferase
VLGNGDVHVWRVALHASSAQLQGFSRTLAADELARAERFVFERSRTEFIAAHGILRSILGAYLGVDAATPRFVTNQFGKPSLLAGMEAHPLRFNLSHSGGLALVVVSRGREVGIDLERLRPDVACEEIATRHFSPLEHAQLQSLPAAERQRAFFVCWTRKEAYIKARGQGLSLSLHDFDVAVLPDRPVSLLATRDDPAEAARWSLVDIDVAPDYAAALAVERSHGPVVCWQWSEHATCD